MAWINGPLTVYHGTDGSSAGDIRTRGIDRSRFRNKADFGAGFYVTTVLHQAQQWANQRTRRASSTTMAEVLQYEISRDTIETLTHISFVVADADYYEFIGYCRSGAANHGPAPRTASYEVVYGPISLWPQRLIIAACDQIVFSNPAAIADFKKPLRSLYPQSSRRLF